MHGISQTVIARAHHAAAIATLLVALPAAAAEFASRPIRVVVPYPPGGTVDVIGRMLAQPYSRAFGQSVVTENRPGAATAIGTEVVARAPADGHTVLLMASKIGRAHV